MNRVTLSIMLVTAVSVVGAQTPPTPPPARPAPAATPAPTPRVIYAPDEFYRFYRPDVEEIRARALEASRMAREIDIEGIRAHALDAARAVREIDHDAIRINAEAVRAHSAQIAEATREASRISIIDAREVAEMAREQARASADFYRYTPMAPMSPMTPMPSMAPMEALAPMAIRVGEDFRMPRPWFQQGEPADSMYRLAHDVLAKGDYGRAAAMFKDIAQKFPNTIYQSDLPYYEAFARYKIGTTNELQNAAKLLEPRASKLIGVVSTQTGSSSYNAFNSGRNRTSDGDVAALYVRVNSVLASRGDNGAAAIVAKAAQAGGTCDREEMQIKAEAMGAVSQMDPAAALPIIKRVLEKKDECSTELRRRAVSLLGRRADSEAGVLLAAAAKSDPSTDVRVEAIGWLPKVQGDAGVNMLEELLRTDQEERIQRAVVRTLNSSDNQRARASMRALIDRKDASTNLRVEAIGAYNSDRSTPDDAAYLRSLYGRADNDRVKDAIINAVARIGGVENDQWILNLARNSGEPSQFRATAISRLMRSNISVADLIKLYDASDTYDVRTRIVGVLENRREQEAADKLFDIARNSTVIQVRMQAVNALNRRKDPRSAQLLEEILNGKRP